MVDYLNYEAITKTVVGCVATFQMRQESDWSSRPGSVSCRHLEQVVDELNLSPHIRTAHPPRLPLPDHVHGLVRSLGSFAAPPEGVGARMRAGLRASNRRARHLPMRYETGLPSSVIRFRTLHASTASRRCPMNCVPEDSRRRSTCTGRTHSPRARADGNQTPSSTVAVRAPSPS